MGTGPRQRRGSCSRTQCSHPGLGGQAGLPRVAAGQSKGLMHLGGGLTFTAPPSLPCRGPRAEPSAGGGQPAPTLAGRDHCMGGSEGGGCQPRLSATTPLSSGATLNPGAGEGELGQVPLPGGGCGGRPGWAIFQCCRCLRVRRERRREEEEEARAAPWVSPRPSPPAAAGLSGDEVAPVREVSLLLLG